MADLWGNLEGSLRGGSDLFDEGAAGVILSADHFEATAAGTVWLGAGDWAGFYRGARSEAALYLGARALH